MKILLQKYPKGTYSGQQTDGKYMDKYLYSNLEVLARSIVKDMTYLGIIFSSTLEVGTGKSVLATQIGEAWTEIMKNIHGIDVPFTTKNVVWRPKDLIKRAFEVPKYSYILLDEWEDATYWSELGITLRQFFRKCRQLNLFIMVIIPNWFQLPMPYAVSRSIFAIDVKFGQNFERGFFSLYNFEAKRDLYILGKRTHNYHIAHPTFFGRFVDGYGVPEAEYRRAKLLDLKRAEVDEPKPRSETHIKGELIKKILSNSQIKQIELAKALGVDRKTIYGWVSSLDHKESDEGLESEEMGEEHTLERNDKIIVWNEDELKQLDSDNTETKDLNT